MHTYSVLLQFSGDRSTADEKTTYPLTMSVQKLRDTSSRLQGWTNVDLVSSRTVPFPMGHMAWALPPCIGSRTGRDSSCSFSVAPRVWSLGLGDGARARARAGKTGGPILFHVGELWGVRGLRWDGIGIWGEAGTLYVHAVIGEPWKCDWVCVWACWLAWLGGPGVVSSCSCRWFWLYPPFWSMIMLWKGSQYGQFCLVAILSTYAVYL